MKLDKFFLAQTMAFLISIPPESKLAKLLSFCLVSKPRPNISGRELLNITSELMEHPSSLPCWTQEVMGLDFDYTSEEWRKVAEMGIHDTTEFMTVLEEELKNLNL